MQSLKNFLIRCQNISTPTVACKGVYCAVCGVRLAWGSLVPQQWTLRAHGQQRQDIAYHYSTIIAFDTVEVAALHTTPDQAG